MYLRNHYQEGIEIAKAVIEQYGYQNGPVWFIDETVENISKVARQINSPWQEKFQNYKNVTDCEHYRYVSFVIFDWGRTFGLNNLLLKYHNYTNRYHYMIKSEYQILSRLVDVISKPDLFYIPECFLFEWKQIPVDMKYFILEKSNLQLPTFMDYKIPNYQTSAVSSQEGETLSFPEMEVHSEICTHQNGCEYHYIGAEASSPIYSKQNDYNRNIYVKQVIGIEKLVPMLMSSYMEGIAQGRLTKIHYPVQTLYQYWEKDEVFWANEGVSLSRLGYSTKRFSTKMPKESFYGLGLPKAIEETLDSEEKFWHRKHPGLPWQLLRQDDNKNFYDEPQQYILISD